MNARAIAIAAGGVAFAALAGCSGSTASPTNASPWCCNLGTDGTWACSAVCGATCPADVAYQENCTYGADGSACTEWSCSSDAGLAPHEASVAADSSAPEAATLPAEASATSNDAASTNGADATPPSGCVPDQICAGIAECNDPCYGSECCQLSCSCEGASGDAGLPSDPSARLACTLSCPP